MVAGEHPMQAKTNPFMILELPTVAGKAAIAARAQELSEVDGEARLLVRWAVDQLLTSASARLRHELAEVPGAIYRDPEWLTFERRHRRRPPDAAALAAASPPPGLADVDLQALLDLLLEGLLELPLPDLEPALRAAPFAPGCGDSPLEVNDVIFR